MNHLLSIVLWFVILIQPPLEPNTAEQCDRIYAEVLSSLYEAFCNNQISYAVYLDWYRYNHNQWKQCRAAAKIHPDWWIGTPE
jgi:hypothetical protein